MSDPLSGDSEPPSPEDSEAAESPGREALAPGPLGPEVAPETHDDGRDDGSDSDSVADSAIASETDILSTMTAPDEFFTFIEENGRTYHSYKASSKLTLPQIECYC